MGEIAMLALKALHRTIGPMLPPRLLSRRLPGIDGRVHVDDLMLTSTAAEHLAQYREVGRVVMAHLAHSLADVGTSLDEVRTFLDLPCGYGRLLRHLVNRIQPRAVTAVDSDPLAVRFCITEFGVDGLVCPADPRQLQLGPAYDVIYVGSLLTHLPEVAGRDLLKRLATHLRSGGILAFTTQGESCLDHLDWYGSEIAAAASQLRADVARAGFGFAPYRRKRLASRQSPADGVSFGVAIQTATQVETLIASVDRRLRCVRFEPRGLMDHQDLWAFTLDAVAGSPLERH